MSKKKKLKTQTPKFQTDPRFSQGIGDLADLGGRLSSFDFSGDLAPLAQTIERDPEITKLALQQAQAELGPAFEDTLNQIKQEAVASNQFESSTFADAISREGGRLNQQFQGITAGAALEDRSRALQNRLSLVGLGSGLTSQATAFAGSNQQQLNEFAQRDFENRLGIEQFNRSNRGGFFGGLTGAAGGALGGFAASGGNPFGALAGGLFGGIAGGRGPAGTGGQLLGAGSSIFAHTRPTTTAGRTAGNTSDLFGGVEDDTNKLLKQLQLFG